MRYIKNKFFKWGKKCENLCMLISSIKETGLRGGGLSQMIGLKQNFKNDVFFNFCCFNEDVIIWPFSAFDGIELSNFFKSRQFEKNQGHQWQIVHGQSTLI